MVLINNKSKALQRYESKIDKVKQMIYSIGKEYDYLPTRDILQESLNSKDMDKVAEQIAKEFGLSRPVK